MKTLVSFLVIYCCVLEAKCQARGRCSTARNEPGTCINVFDCPYVISLIKTKRHNTATKEYISNSICSQQGPTTFVCCPDSPKVEPLFPGNHFVMGGSVAEERAWPWIAALGFRNKGQTAVRFHCGATLIHKRYLLSAAHCFNHNKGTSYMVRFGQIDLNQTVKDDVNVTDIQVESFIIHPEYKRATKVHDIALLRLSNDALFEPICLPIRDRSNSYTNRTAFVGGWGFTSFRDSTSGRQILHVAQVEVFDNNKCRPAYSLNGVNITKWHICAGTNKGGVDACTGDSGGPLMLPDPELDDRFYLIGVISSGISCGVKKFPGVYARTTEYIDWIQENMTP